LPASTPAFNSGGHQAIAVASFRTPAAIRAYLDRAIADLNRQHPRQLVSFCPLAVPGAVELSYPDTRGGTVSILLAARGNRVYRITRHDASRTPTAASNNRLVALAAPLLTTG
jgi:hypothetical protein